jgi:hypothetical protein
MADDASALRSLAGEAQVGPTGIAYRSIGPQSKHRLKAQSATREGRINRSSFAAASHLKTMRDMTSRRGGKAPLGAISGRQHVSHETRFAATIDFRPLR